MTAFFGGGHVKLVRRRRQEYSLQENVRLSVDCSRQACTRRHDVLFGFHSSHTGSRDTNQKTAQAAHMHRF
jgi:hypothetical protein